jgi:MoxR-like ATPase
MPNAVELEQLRTLRGRAEKLLVFLESDLGSFLHPFDRVTFLRTPESERKRNDVNVTTTCSCLMAVALTKNFGIYAEGTAGAVEAFSRVVKAPWSSSGLDINNAFTTTLVLRTLGFLLGAGLTGRSLSKSAAIKPWVLNDASARKRTLSAIASAMARPDRFSINNYPPTSTVVYWFVDGADRAQIPLPVDAVRSFCLWAQDEFNHQLSLVVAEHEATMDPVAMAMAACVCARLRSVLELKAPSILPRGNYTDALAKLPSTIELERSILQLIKHQRNGIWPKYFPLFHYDRAGSNFCFTFELLEAILVEFAGPKNQLLDKPEFLHALEDGVTWCERNRLTWRGKSAQEYSGWNSGGFLDTLKKGQPESWATAVVYMYLWELRKVLSEQIQRRLLTKYDSTTQLSKEPKALDEFLPIEIAGAGRNRSLRSILREKLISRHSDESEHTLRAQKSNASRSALLFGPPGTSKTGVVSQVAKELGWPLIKIDPSHFLKQNLDKIYIQAGEIFTDLMDLAGVVVLFDEMDALVQTREADVYQDTTAQFLTTFMLPKILALHDHGRIIFFMATNFQHKFDQAIKRPGRFDLLLCMGPPSFAAKLNALSKFTGEANPTDNVAAAKLLSQYADAEPQLRAQLELYTFDEFKSLVRALRADHKSLASSLRAKTAKEVAEFVKHDSRSVTLQLRGLAKLEKDGRRYKTIKQIKSLDVDREELKKSEIRETPLIQYLIDRRESRVPQE